MKPDTSDLADHFKHYINLVEEEDIIQALAGQGTRDIDFFQSISEEQSDYQYAPGKWTIKEVLQHIIDSERIFAYRALAIARMEKGVLAGFDEAWYAQHAHPNERKWSDMVKEYRVARDSTIEMAKSFHESDMPKSGPVSTYSISVAQMLFVTVGHVIHHNNIIREKYLNK